MRVTLDQMQVGNWGHGGTVGYVRYYSSEDFEATDGVKFLAGTAPMNSFFLETTASISGSTFTAPAVPNFPTTTDALDNQEARITAAMFDSARVFRGYLFYEFRITHSLGSTLTLEQLTTDNAARIPFRDLSVYTVTQTNNQINATLRPNASAVTLGMTRLSDAPVDASQPIAEGQNSARLALLDDLISGSQDVVGSLDFMSALSVRRTSIPQRKIENTATYDAFPLALYHPTAGLQVYARRGTRHASGDAGHIRRWYPTGLDDFASVSVLDESGSGVDESEVTGGISSSDTIILFVSRWNFTGSVWIDVTVLRSTDAGATFSNVGTIPVGGATVYSAHGPMIEVPYTSAAAGYRLYQTLYSITPSPRRAWVVYSDDDGLTWTTGADIKTSAVNTPSETSLVYVDGTGASARLLAVIRDVDAELWQFVSLDGGATWTDQGRLPFSSGVDTDVSPWMVNLGDGRITLCWADRATTQLKTVTARGADVIAGVAGWGGVASVRIIYGSNIRDMTGTPATGHFGYPSIARMGTGKGKEGLAVVFYDLDRTSANVAILDVVDCDLSIMPLFPPAQAKLNITATLNVPDNTATALPFGEAQVMTEGYWVLTTPTEVLFTEAGMHRVSAVLSLSVPGVITGKAHIEFQLNGAKTLAISPVSTFDEFFTAGVHGDCLFLNLSVEHPFRAGDTLKVFVTQTNSTASTRTVVNSRYSSAEVSISKI